MRLYAQLFFETPASAQAALETLTVALGRPRVLSLYQGLVGPWAEVVVVFATGDLPAAAHALAEGWVEGARDARWVEGRGPAQVAGLRSALLEREAG